MQHRAKASDLLIIGDAVPLGQQTAKGVGAHHMVEDER